MAAKTCEHAACSCAVGPEEPFCSRACREAARLPVNELEGCRCGHVACLGAAGRAGDEALAGGVPEVSAGGSL